MELFWKRLHHFAAALQLRASLYLEVARAKRHGAKVHRNVLKKIWSRPHDEEEYIWLLRFISSNIKVNLIDIGGNTGYWSHGFLEYFPKASIYAFEPIPEIYKQYVNRYADNEDVTVINVALGDVKELKDIYVAKGYGLTSFHTYGEQLSDRNENFERTIKVQIDCLDHYVDRMQWPHDQFTVIKVDVQGFEFKVVQGGKEVFSKADILIVECSFINEYKDELPTFGELACLLRQLDMHPIQFGVFDRKRAPIAYERNVLFVKSHLFEKIWN